MKTIRSRVERHSPRYFIHRTSVTNFDDSCAWSVVGSVQDYLLMDPRVRQVDGRAMVAEMQQNIEIMLRKKKHAIQVRETRCAVSVYIDDCRPLSPYVIAAWA